MKLRRMLFYAWISLVSPHVWATAYVPKDDHEILEYLPVNTSERSKLNRLRQQTERAPLNYELTLALAQAYIETGRNNADPRYFGYAESALQPWLTGSAAKPDALVLHATILQHRHDFPAALMQLKSALALNPRLTQAWLTLSAIHEVRGDYRAALQSCLKLARLTGGLATATCIHSALSLNGQAAYAYEQLAAAATAANDAVTTNKERVWAYIILAEMAERLTKRRAAENWYLKALALDQANVYLLTCYADFLLDEKRPAEVIALLQNKTGIDALLLRLILAEQNIGHKAAEKHIATLQSRIAAAKLRGDKTHQGDEARFNLHILHKAESALTLAAENWAVQKEPRDARVLLETALAANKPQAAKAVADFFAKTHLEDARLAPLLQPIRGDQS